MKARLISLLLLTACYCFSQSINDYKAVIIPLKYDFLNSDNQYRLITNTKINLKKAGFEAFYINEPTPKDYGERCGLLYIDVKNESSFFVTKLYVVLKDCNEKIVFRSPIGESREKDFEAAYTQALKEAFFYVSNLHYKYNGKSGSVQQSQKAPNSVAAPIATISSNDANVSANSDAGLLYAQTTANGYQLVDSTPKVVMNVFKTSISSCYIASKGNVNGVLIMKENQWFFEYYQNNVLVSEKVLVRF